MDSWCQSQRRRFRDKQCLDCNPSLVSRKGSQAYRSNLEIKMATNPRINPARQARPTPH
jgi:hypothetical protein